LGLTLVVIVENADVEFRPGLLMLLLLLLASLVVVGLEHVRSYKPGHRNI